MGTSGAQWIIGSYASRAYHVVLDPVHGGLQQALIISKLLQRAHASARLKDGYKVARLDLFVDEPL